MIKEKKQLCQKNQKYREVQQHVPHFDFGIVAEQKFDFRKCNQSDFLQNLDDIQICRTSNASFLRKFLNKMTEIVIKVQQFKKICCCKFVNALKIVGKY